MNKSYFSIKILSSAFNKWSLTPNCNLIFCEVQNCTFNSCGLTSVNNLKHGIPFWHNFYEQNVVDPFTPNFLKLTPCTVFYPFLENFILHNLVFNQTMLPTCT